MLMNTSVCPFSCETSTYKKFNEVERRNITSPGGVELVLIQDDSIEQRTEEELFGLPKLFSEIGGLSSFFFGFSCLILFDLLEMCVRVSVSWCVRFCRSQRKRRNHERQLQLTIIRQNSFSRWLKNRGLAPNFSSYHQGIPYAPHCLPMSEESPIFQHRPKPGSVEALVEIKANLLQNSQPEESFFVAVVVDGVVTTVAVENDQSSFL